MGTICIYEEADYINTLSVKALLDSSEIITHMPNEHLGGALPGMGLCSSTFRIFVPEDQVDDAMDILKAHLFIDDKETEKSETIFNPTETVVLNGEKVEKPEVCPKCGSEDISTSNLSRFSGIILSLLIMIPAAVSKSPKKKCRTCHHQWV